MTLNYNSPAELRAFLESRRIGMRKRYGQNFLINPHAREKLLEALEFNKEEAVWEIGPGLGAMTGGLLAGGAEVTAFEIDPAFIAILKELFGEYINFNLVEGDALKTWPGIAQQENVPENNLFLLGNLPYNIAAALLGSFIEKKRYFKKMVITVQRELAQRMTARPLSKDYSSFTVMCSSVYKVSPLMIIKGSSFYPVPRVDSEALVLELLPNRKELSRLFFALVRSLFASRRKTIQNNLINFINSAIMYSSDSCLSIKDSSELAVEAIKRSGLSGSLRAEAMETGDLAALAKNLEEILDRGR